MVGTRIAVYLSQRGEKVTLVDSDKSRCLWVSKHSDAVVYNGNALDPDILAEAEIEKADSLIIALGNDQSARDLVKMAKFKFAVPRVIAVAKDPASKEKILRLGAEKVISVEESVLKEIKTLLHRRGHRVLYHDPDSDYRIEQVSVRATSSMLGKRISALGNRLAKVAGVLRGGILLFPKEELELQMGDEVIVIGQESGVGKVCAQIEA